VKICTSFLLAEDFPNGSWLGDENNPEMRVRVPITPRWVDAEGITCNSATENEFPIELCFLSES